MMVDILVTNRENILETVQRFHHTLDTIEHCLEAGDMENLRLQLAQGAARYASLVAKEGAKG
jgi:prephenate dehydrogenase